MHKWDDNIKTDLGEIGCEVTNWTELIHDRVQRYILMFTTVPSKPYLEPGQPSLHLHNLFLHFLSNHQNQSQIIWEKI
jgi:hypothetical protein